MQYFKKLLEIFIVSTRLGFTSFGGPVAHLGYFHQEYVRKRKWMDEKSYADLVALSQFLPGPASSQVGIGIGVMRGGVLGGIVSFIGFTMPSVIALILFAYFAQQLGLMEFGIIQGLKIVAVVIVAHAILGMAKSLTPDLTRKSIALFALLITLLIPHNLSQIGVILVAGLLGYFMFSKKEEHDGLSLQVPLSKKIGLVCLSLFFGLLTILPILSSLISSTWLSMVDSFYRAGALVFGGGHVVLPLLEREFVPTGFISEEAFLSGYAAAQAVPGPLFTFAAFIGADMNGWLGGMIATFSIFLPAILLIFGVLPFWHALRKNHHIRGAFIAINAAVVGILISAFYMPIWTSAIITPLDFSLAAILFFMLVYWKLPPWLIVLAGALGGVLIEMT
ncbi:chromate efflux transporter [Cytobacillus kochii]|uniref:chromate efflux transporter n=1 Tax=Cytobacillus kochii TaxID=859143 RepID=UPI00204003F7|nr:chromate efflux transporter [Cytobacillus kochii]MCM3322638.1 chromate efflux transporter [Cytobacillus kochii]MCM3344883.1 chromate efflux transporter [Cytobacillus kochii]